MEFLRNQSKSVEQKNYHLEDLFNELHEIKKENIHSKNLKTNVTPLVEESLANWLNKLEKFEIKLTDRDDLIETLSGLIIELLNNKAIDSKEELVSVLYPIVGVAINKQVRDEPDIIIDALFPVIGRTVSKYVSEALKELVAKVDAQLNKTLSISRWISAHKAKKLGVSESTYLLRQSLPFTIENIFMIDKKSGLLISHISIDDKESIDKDLVAGMLTAIKDFVSSAFQKEESKETLNEIEYGNQKILLEEATYYYLALVVHGNKKEKFHDEIIETISEIQKGYRSKLSSYNGDSSSVVGIDRPLKKLIERVNTSVQEKAKKERSKTKIILGLLTLGLLVWLGFSAVDYYYDKEIETKSKIIISESASLKGFKVGVSVDSQVIHITGIMPDNSTLQKVQSKLSQIEKVKGVKFDGTNLENLKPKETKDSFEQFRSQYIQFESGKSKLTDYHKYQLHNIIFAFKKLKLTKITIVSYLDNKDDQRQNVVMNKRRTDSVITYLTADKIINSQIISTSQKDQEISESDPNYKPRSLRVILE